MSLFPSRQSGVALIAALLLMTSIVFILGNIFYRHQINVAHQTLSIHEDQAFLLALSAESWARQLLEEDFNDSKADHFAELWAQAIPAMPVDGGMINGCISDLQSRFNLNNFLVGYASPGALSAALSGDVSSFAKIWNNLLRYLDMPVYPGRVEAIIDWLDKGSSKIGPDGAEQDEYAGAIPPRMIADSAMVESSELASVLGYEIFEVQRLSPWITALPIDPITAGVKQLPVSINVNTASEELLLALGDTYDMQFRDAVIMNRPFEELIDFHNQLAIDLALPVNDIARRWPEAIVDVRSGFFELYIEVMLGEARIEVRSIIMRSSRGDSVIISRDLTTVPASVDKNSASALLEKLLAGAKSDKESAEIIDDQQVQPACLMIGA
ncbi:MAG: type II secretion system minor pseudopilin GspK [Porticoccaceae bacterium]